MRISLYLCATFALAGCVTTVDLAKQSDLLPPEDRYVVPKILAAFQKACVKTQKDPYTQKSNPGGGAGFYQTPSINKLHKSSGGWYKADLTAQSIFDSVYYEPSRGKFICGEETWSATSESKYNTFSPIALAGEKTTNSGPEAGPEISKPIFKQNQKKEAGVFKTSPNTTYGQLIHNSSNTVEIVFGSQVECQQYLYKIFPIDKVEDGVKLRCQKTSVSEQLTGIGTITNKKEMKSFVMYTKNEKYCNNLRTDLSLEKSEYVATCQ